jgi:multiple sugar transport system substrate-binding protein
MAGTNGKRSSKSEINFWVMPNAGVATRGILQTSVDEFERLNPDVKVNLVVHPWSLAWNRLVDVIKGRYLGPRPDVVQVGTTHVATLAYLGALDKIPDSGVLLDSDSMSTYIWDPGTHSTGEQDLFCVPWFIDVRVLYYRKDIFEQLGIPTELLNDWKGFRQACSIIKQSIGRNGPAHGLIAPVAFPGQKPGVLMHDLAPWIWGAGGDFCTEDLSQASLDSAEAQSGCETLFDMINDSFMPIPHSAVPSGNFFTGHYAMQLSGSWPAATYLNPNSPYSHRQVAEGFGVALLPAGPRGRFTFLGGSNLAVAAVSENKAASWRFVRFMSEPTRLMTHAQSIGALTARVASLEDLFRNHAAEKRIFWDSLGHARRLPRLVELGSVEQIVFKLGLRVLSLIRTGEYSERLLQREILSANNGINAVLSLHRYGAKTPVAAGA